MNKTILRRSETAAHDQDAVLLHEHPLLDRIYHARGVREKAELDRELSALAPAAQLKDLDQAVERLATALINNETVIIIGDFDADGATSSALAVLALQAMGMRRVSYLVPNRFEFGYGLSPEIVELAALRKPALIVTVDNGISSITGVKRATELGIDVIITDHHLPGAELPAALAIVNPNQPACEFPSKNLAGVGVIFYVMTALRTYLKSTGWFESQSLPVPNMADYLDLVALGTVADVVPLDSNNRILVYQGLRRIRAGRARPGILALLEFARRRHERVVAADLGFAIGPRLNAAGRLDDMSLGIACLLSDNAAIAREMAVELDRLNHDRRAIEQQMQQEALQILDRLLAETQEQGLPAGLCLFDPAWHQGVVGILASRLKDRFHRPVIAFALADDGQELKGSARSIQGIHIRDVLDQVATDNPGLITRFGGHAMAAGLSLPREELSRFQTAFAGVVDAQLEEGMLEARILSDGELQSDELNLFVAGILRESGPWGQQFPEPLFDGEFYIVQQRKVGERHLKLLLSLDRDKRQLIDAIAFNVDVEQWLQQRAEALRMVYRLDINEYREQQSVQLVIEYLEPLAVHSEQEAPELSL